MTEAEDAARVAQVALRALREFSWRTRRELVGGDEMTIPAGETVEIVAVALAADGWVSQQERVSVRWVGAGGRPVYAHAVHLSHLEAVD